MKPTRRRRWLSALLVLTSGMLLQSTCNTVASDMVGGLGTSISTQLIRNLIYDRLGVGGASSLST